MLCFYLDQHKPKCFLNIKKPSLYHKNTNHSPGRGWSRQTGAKCVFVSHEQCRIYLLSWKRWQIEDLSQRVACRSHASRPDFITATFKSWLCWSGNIFVSHVRGNPTQRWAPVSWGSGDAGQRQLQLQMLAAVIDLCLTKWATYFYRLSRCTHVMLISHEDLVYRAAIDSRGTLQVCKHTNTHTRLSIFMGTLHWFT